MEGLGILTLPDILYPRIREAVDVIYQFSSFKNKDFKKQEKRRYVRSIFKIVVLL